MPRGFAAQRAHLTQVESRPRADWETSAGPGRFLGNISSTEVWRNLQQGVEAVLVDIRTQAEWKYVGVPDLSGLGKSLMQVEWQVFPSMERNPRFLRELQARGVTPGRLVYLICRSGIRSRDAAQFLAERGYVTCNVAEGFEGPLDDDGHRGASGWRAEGLPWTQS
ncbi:MAG: rhodanese-like domain-containing protein [Candidatus Contendobacter sp.]|nr:rhodanese-like domain-containing protein [Candidatus Contendobacter sp.]MDS4059610.1 rhodanese-like domain-containing protein [Candidatus Contendobacter sp.]